MPRPCHRARLESGLKLDLNRLIRRGQVGPGLRTTCWIGWSRSGETVASADITSDMTGSDQGWIKIKMGAVDQWIELAAQTRHFGGRQWYFVCPWTHRKVSVLWMPPGARQFASRQRWGRQVAYGSQFSDRITRAHQGKDRINRRLCAIGGFDPGEWDLAPKPKWMRWQTYNRAVEKFDHYEAILDEGTYALVMRLGLVG